MRWLPWKRCLYCVRCRAGRLFEQYKLYSKFVSGHCFKLKLTFFCNCFTLSNISSLIKWSFDLSFYKVIVHKYHYSCNGHFRPQQWRMRSQLLQCMTGLMANYLFFAKEYAINTNVLFNFSNWCFKIFIFNILKDKH